MDGNGRERNAEERQGQDRSGVDRTDKERKGMEPNISPIRFELMKNISSTIMRLKNEKLILTNIIISLDTSEALSIIIEAMHKDAKEVKLKFIEQIPVQVNTKMKGISYAIFYKRGPQGPQIDFTKN